MRLFRDRQTMLCPHCGAETPSSGGSCPSCRRSLAHQVLAATQTPPPEFQPEAVDPLLASATAETRLAGESSLGASAQKPEGAAGPLAPGEPLGSRYRVLSMLGAGGMGVVYKAWDEELGVAVALKVVRREITADPWLGPEMERRFKRELLLAREVTHRNVVRIHDLGEVNGIKYISMPFVEGQSLAARLASAGKLSIQEGIRIARQIAAGLSAAHEAGVVHRDLKPENVMLDNDGRALIMDFGISRSTSKEPAGPPPPAGEQKRHRTVVLDSAELLSGMTVAGAVIGTLEYMAPEQARAEPIDQRADIYAFGLIFRDMLLGTTRLTGTTAVEELRSRMQHAPPAPRSVNAQIPAPLDQVIRRCLEPDRAVRFQTSQELVAALDRLDDNGQLRPEPRRFGRRQVAAGIALVVALLAATWWFASRLPPPEPGPVSVLIADFENRTSDPAFDGALEEALTIAIEEASFINAYQRDDARTLAEQLSPGGRLDENTARLVSLREGINVILAGTIEPRRSGFALSLKALDPTNGKVLGTAAESAGSKDDVLRAIGSLAGDARGMLGDTSAESVKAGAAETVTAASLEAVGEYSKAQDLLYSSKDEEAIPHYKRAIEHDPNFGRAYSGWAISAQNLGRRDEALQAWNKAVSLVDRMTEREKYRTLGNYYIAVPRNYPQAVDNLSRLVELYPYDRGGHVNIAIAYFYMRNFTKALEHGRRSVEIAPKDVINRANLALYGMYSGEFSTAAAEARAVLKQDPKAYRSYLPIAMAAIAAADFNGGRRAYSAMAEAGAPGSSLATLGLADLALYRGQPREAEALLTKGIAADEARSNTAGLAAKSVALAEAHLAEGETRAATNAARRALKLLGHGAPAVPAARVLIAAGAIEEARTLAATLANDLQPELRAYAKLLEGEMALRERRFVAAADALLAGQKLADLWWARLTLGIAYLEAGHPAEALGELELCRKRRGEATAILLDDLPSIRYLAPLPYWLARAQEAVGQQAAARATYAEFLQLRSDAKGVDPLVDDAQRRLEALNADGR